MANGLAQRIHFAFRIKLWIARRVVIVSQRFHDPAVAHADHVAGRKVHQPGMTALSQEFEQVDCRINVGGKGIAQIGIEIRQPCAVYNQIKRLSETGLRGVIQAQARLAHVAFHDFHLLFQKSAELSPVPIVERIERGRFLDDFLETPPC